MDRKQIGNMFAIDAKINGDTREIVGQARYAGPHMGTQKFIYKDPETQEIMFLWSSNIDERPETLHLSSITRVDIIPPTSLGYRIANDMFEGGKAA